MKNLGAIIVSTIVSAGFISVVFLWFYRPLTMSSDAFQVLTILVGALTSNFTTVVGYWLGSSAGSSNKDELLMRQNAALQAQPATPVTVSTTDAQVKAGDDAK